LGGEAAGADDQPDPLDAFAILAGHGALLAHGIELVDTGRIARAAVELEQHPASAQ
jgi:hypothetical protein